MHEEEADIPEPDGPQLNNMKMDLENQMYQMQSLNMNQEQIRAQQQANPGDAGAERRLEWPCAGSCSVRT